MHIIPQIPKLRKLFVAYITYGVLGFSNSVAEPRRKPPTIFFFPLLGQGEGSGLGVPALFHPWWRALCAHGRLLSKWADLDTPLSLWYNTNGCLRGWCRKKTFAHSTVRAFMCVNVTLETGEFD